MPRPLILAERDGMSENGLLMVPEAGGNVGREVFVLTDEQILGMEDEGAPVAVAASGAAAAQDADQSGREKGAQSLRDSGQAGVTVPQEAPGWLAERMRDPWVGDEARELWVGAQRAQRESAAFREVFATPEEARELKQVYPGGASEAKAAAERAKQLEEIDAAYFGAVGKAPEELRAGRTQLVERWYAQNPGAFREMVDAALKLIGGTGGATSAEAATSGQRAVPSAERADRGATSERDKTQSGVTVPQEVAANYREFERAANAELERSVGGAIARSMEQALPNLRRMSATGGEQVAGALPARLANAVREEIDAALRSDAQLGEQVSRILAGRKFDEGSRAQVVRLIDARAQQLVPGAVRRVVGAWTEATVSGRRAEGKSAPRAAESAKAASARGRRVDYGKLSDEEILEL